MKKIRGYENLKPRERFNLAVAAAARDDEAEFARLHRAAPRKKYIATDMDYLDLKDTAMNATLAFCVDLTEMIGKAQILTVLAAQYEDRYEAVRQCAVRRAIDQMALFNEFAKEHLGMTAEVLLSAFCRPVLVKFRELTRGSDDYQGKVDPVLADEMTTLWRDISSPSNQV